MRRNDPAPQPKLAVPPTVPTHLMRIGRFSRNSNNTSKLQAVGDMSVVAFYCLLRVGEYTYRTKRRDRKKQRNQTRTVQFRVGDVAFRRNNQVLSNKSSLATLLSADEATLCISNQKNGKKGQHVHHHAFDGEDCPVKALARRAAHIMSHTSKLSTVLGTFFDINGNKHHLVSDDMNKAVKRAVRDLNMKNEGYTEKLVGSHSLRAGGAMAMKLNGVDRDTIKKQGRWSSDTFLMCIHEQISQLSEGIAAKMSTRRICRNIAPVRLIDANASAA